MSSGSTNGLVVGRAAARRACWPGPSPRTISRCSGRNPEGLCPPSDLTRHKAERTVRGLIEEAHRENLRLLGEHREELDELASRLLDRVEIAGDEVREVVGRRRTGEEAAAADQAAA